MAINNFGLTGIGSNVQFGKAGPRISKTVEGLEFLDAASAVHINLTAASPVAPQHLATKQYVDNFVSGLSVKQSVRVATNAALPAATYDNGNGTLTADGNGALVIDGISVAENNRVLVKNYENADAVQNGIYVVTSTGDVSSPFILTRSDDANQDSEVMGGMFCFVEEGTVNGDTGWAMDLRDASGDSKTGNATLGTDRLLFFQFSSTAQLEAGAALSKSGNTLNVLVDSVTVGVNGSNQLIVRSDATSGHVLVSSGTPGTAATWSFIDDLRHGGSGRFIIDGVDAGSANNNFLRVASGASGNGVTITATNENGGSDDANVDLVLATKGTGSIVLNAQLTNSSGNLVIAPNGDVELGSDIDVKSSVIKTTETNGDVVINPNGTGVISVAGTTDYENNVSDDDDIPNKKYVDDSISNIQFLDGVRRATITANSTDSVFDISTVLPSPSVGDVYVNTVTIHVSTEFAGGDTVNARVMTSSDVLVKFEEVDIENNGTYIVNMPMLIPTSGEQIQIEFYEADGTTAAIPTSGVLLITVEYKIM